MWRAMLAAPRIELRAPRAARAQYLVRAYRDIVENRAALDEALTRLPVRPGRERLKNWRELADAGAFAELAEALMELHYDPAYDRSSRKDTRETLGVVEIADLGPAGRAQAAEAVARLVADP
jgi:tRNA 2-selenouridine synthase